MEVRVERLLLSTPGVDPVVYKPRPTGDGLEAHNTYLGTAAELGFPGLVLYLGFSSRLACICDGSHVGREMSERSSSVASPMRS